MGNNAAAIRVNHTRDNADRLLLLLNASCEDVADRTGAEDDHVQRIMACLCRDVSPRSPAHRTRRLDVALSMSSRQKNQARPILNAGSVP
jgi:hypothetical protein